MRNIRWIVANKLVDEQDFSFVRTLISSHPTWSRWRLSRWLAEAWNIRTTSGQLKDMSVRNFLNKMEKHHLIVLPSRRRASVKRKPLNLPELFDRSRLSVTDPLVSLRPLQIDVMTTAHPLYSTFARSLALHHYLGYRGPQGENIGYYIRDRHSRGLACLLFGGAAWKTNPRDAFLGWDATTRERRLSYLTNNTRFLILPGVSVPHLASHLLGLITRRLSHDWQIKYGHPVYAVETFVERDRFRGTCYRAANWIYLGQTQGRTRADRFTTIKAPVKDIYLYPLIPKFRKKLCHGDP